MKVSTTKTLIFIIGMLLYNMSVSAQSIGVHTSNYKQTIDMIGGDMERSSKAIQNAQNKQEIIDWSFRDINFNVCRVQYDKNQELIEGTKNWAFYDKQIASMQAIKQVNPNIKFFATMRSDYDGYGNDNNLPDWIINYGTKVMEREKYGIFLADYLEYMSQQGVPISIISTAKEWMWHVKAEKARDIINKMNSELDARGIARPIISDQGFWSISQGITYLNHVEDLSTIDLYQSFCSHNYDNESSEKWVELIEKSNAMGKPMYDDETSTGSGSPTYGVERAMYKQIGEYIKKAERYKAGLSGEIFFEIWSRGIDKETRAIYFPANGTGTRLRGYYLMKHFSNNILDSKYITSTITSLRNIYTISFRKDDEVVLWVINKSTTEYPLVPITVDAFEITDFVNVHYWTDNTPIEGSSAKYNANGNVFETSIAGESISCYIFNVRDEADNIALIGTASQSSTENDAIASRAIDGNTDGTLAKESVSQTGVEENAWWQIDFGVNDTIGEICVYNRTDDCCLDNLSNFTVSVINSDNTITFSHTYSSVPNPSINIDTKSVIGQIVKIQLEGSNSLSLAEVQVFKGKIFERLDQTIDFPELKPVKYSLEPFSPGATASSGLGIEYASSNLKVATVVDRKIIINGVGTSTLSASIHESSIYNAARSVSQSLVVIKADQQIIFPQLPVKKVGNASFILEAEASSGLELAYVSSNLQVAKIENKRIIIVGEGTSTITASQIGNDKYNAAANSSQIFTVEKADDGVITDHSILTPAHDAYVRGGSYANTNYASESELLIKETSSTDYLRKTLLQFDIYDIDEADKIEKVMLRLYATSGNPSQIMLYKTTDNWNEATVTYNNAPSEGESITSQEVTSSGIYYEWDVSDFIEEQMEADDIVSFILADVSSNKNNISFNSKEADDNLPQLVITKEDDDDISVIPIYTELNKLFTIFPNPVINELSVNSGNFKIKHMRLYNLSGQLLKEIIHPIHISTINLSDLNTGLYYLIMDSDVGSVVKKIIKK